MDVKETVFRTGQVNEKSLNITIQAFKDRVSYRLESGGHFSQTYQEVKPKRANPESGNRGNVSNSLSDCIKVSTK